MFGGGMAGGGGLFGRPPGGPMSGGLTHSSDLSDDIVFGKVYDQKVVGRLAVYLNKYKIISNYLIMSKELFTSNSIYP